MRDGDTFKMGDADPMPYGKHKGRPMEDVPGTYLLWLIENDRASPAVKEYIQHNMDVILKEIREKQNK